MVLENITMLMAHIIKESLRMGIEMGKEYFIIQVEQMKGLKDCGLMGN